MVMFRNLSLSDFPGAVILNFYGVWGIIDTGTDELIRLRIQNDSLKSQSAVLKAALRVFVE
jgi:hypothetical protein